MSDLVFSFYKNALAGTDSDADSESTKCDSDTVSYDGNEDDDDNFPSNVVSGAEYEAQLRQAQSLLDDDVDPEFDDTMSVPANDEELTALESTFETSHLQLMMVVEETSEVMNQLSTLHAELSKERAVGLTTETRLDAWVECNNGKYFQVATS